MVAHFDAPYVNDCLLSKSAAVNQYFEPQFVRELLEEHEQDRAHNLRHIYLLLSFELWHRQFISS